MIEFQQVKVKIPHTREDLIRKVCRQYHIRQDEICSFHIVKRSLDARKKPELYYVYQVRLTLKHEKHFRKYHCVPVTPYQCECHGTHTLPARPVIIGTGPAGLFCGYQMAKRGYRPVLLERGECVEQRSQDVESFWKGAALNPESNVQFGEGGAGTFSDGKLNTLVTDKKGRNREVLKTFVEFGAPEEILYEAKPHIGTDLLMKIVSGMRKEIIRLGGEVRFHTKAVHFVIRDQKLKELVIQDTHTKKTSVLETSVAVLAIGHSARDTFQELFSLGVQMQAKSFAVGVRVEHPQSFINTCQYGKAQVTGLPAAAYKLTAKAEDGRGVYTFCMCPGGYVVNASSEAGALAVNGMSYSGRDGINANSAVIVTVTPQDFGGCGPLAGVEFQRRLEKAAYAQGQGHIPVQRFEDYRKNRRSRSQGKLAPQMKGLYRFANVREIFPESIGNAIEEGILAFDRKLPGYADADTLLSGVESRTSSPVRILRDEAYLSNIRGIYPCGEGAGYAGGITSAAMDGLKVSESIIQNWTPFDKVRNSS